MKATARAPGRQAPKARRSKKQVQLQDDRVAKLATFTLSPECIAKLARLHGSTGKPKSNIVEMAIMAIRETGGADADA